MKGLNLKRVENSRSKKTRSRSSKKALKGTKWSKEEVSRLKDLYQKGYSVKEIGKKLQRSKGGVRGKIYNLGLAKKSRPKSNLKERKEFFESLGISGIVEESNNDGHKIPVIEEEVIDPSWEEEKLRAKRLRILGGEF